MIYWKKTHCLGARPRRTRRKLARSSILGVLLTVAAFLSPLSPFSSPSTVSQPSASLGLPDFSFLFRPQAAAAHGEAVVIEGVPSIKQRYSLSCEYAAAAAVTLFWGGEVVSQDHFISEVPTHPNPHLGFRGDINGPHGGTRDYGVYAEPLVPVLEAHGYDATVFYGGAARLKAEIDDGHPVVVWLTTGKATPRQGFYQTYAGERFKLVAYEHTVVVYGYDEAGVYLMDVGDGGRYYTEWESFLPRWGYFDEMALLIHPK